MKRLVATVPVGWPALSPPPPLVNSFGTGTIEVAGVAEFAAYVADADPRTDADWQTVVNGATPDLSAQNADSLRTNLAADVVALQAIIDDTNANINTNPATRIKTLARAVRRLAKVALNDFSTPD